MTLETSPRTFARTSQVTPYDAHRNPAGCDGLAPWGLEIFRVPCKDQKEDRNDRGTGMPGIRLVDVRAALAALGLAGLAALAVAITTHLPMPAPSGPATHTSSAGLSRLQSLPLQAQSLISSTIAADSRAFAARRTASGWGLSGGGVRADFRSGAPVMRTAGGTLSLSLAGVPGRPR